jgi:membrane-associated phospholipid phosphatase
MLEPAQPQPLVLPFRRPGRAEVLLAWLRPDLTLLILCSGALTVVGYFYGAHYVWRLSTMLLPGLVAPGIVLLHVLRGVRGEALRERARETMRDWLPLVLVAIVFDNLENYTALVRKTTIDSTLWAVDRALFNVEPTVWMRHLYNPLLTDWLAASYGSFLITPMTLAIALALARRRDDFCEVANAVMLQMWIAFFIFICLPAGPPRYFGPLLAGAFRTPLPSLLGLNDRLQATWDTYSPLLVRASFPSLHCAYATLTLIYAWRYGDVFFARRRLFFWLVLPLEISLIVATIYLRHHWIPDCAAGILLAIVAVALSRWLREHWPRQVQSRLAARA